MPPINSQQTRKPALLERLLAVRPFWVVVVATATLMSASLTAQVRTSPVFLMPDTTPVPPQPQVEPPPERPVPPTPPAEPQTPAEPEGPPIRPEGETLDDTGGQSGGQALTAANDIFLGAGSDEAYVADASVADTIAQVETELRKALKISATEPGLRVRVQKGAFLGATVGLWRYLSPDNIQVWARWILPTNTSSGLKFFAQYQYTGPYSGDSAEFFNPANYAISEESRLYVQDTNIGGQIASWTLGRPVNFWTLLTREVPGGSTFTVESLTAEFAPLTNLSVNGDAYGDKYFTVSADLTTSPEFPGLQPILDVQRKLRRISMEGTGTVAAVPGLVKPAEPVIPNQTINWVPAVRSDVTSETSPAIKPETPVEPATTETVLTANGGLQGLTLQADYPKIEVAENAAFIPLFFTVLGTYTGTNDVVVRARFITGTATPGVDFELGEQDRSLPAQGGLTTVAWIAVPTLLDEVNEGNETAVFEVFIVGSTNAPIRIEATLLEDSNPGQVGFVSTRFQINEGSTNGYAQIRLWRTLNTRQAATVSYRLDGPAAALAVLGGQTRRTATFQPGDSQIFVQIPLVNDTTAQGTQDVTLTLEPAEGGLKLMKGFESTVLTLADDETPSPAEPLNISQYDAGGGQRGVMLSTRVARGYQVLLECSDTGAAGPWRPYWRFEGADVERVTFDSFDASVMRMYRILPPEPLDMTFPW